LLDAIANALNNIVGFFRGIYDFIVDIPKAIYNFFTTGFKLIFEGLRNLSILLFNVIVELWNWIADVIKSIFINPILNFIHDIVDRINRKLDGIIFILIGVPIIYKQFEDFIKEPSKKKIGWLILSPIALYILSKAIANWIRKRKYTPLAIPSFKLEKPEELKRNIAIMDQRDVLLEDYAVVTKGLPFITRIDSLINDSFSYSTIKRNIAFVNAKDKLLDGDAVSFRKAPMTRLDISFTDRLVNDAYTFVVGQPSKLYLTSVDELFSESTNIALGIPILLSSDSLVYDSVDIMSMIPLNFNQSDDLLSDNQSYTIYKVRTYADISYVDNAFSSIYTRADDSYVDNIFSTLYANTYVIYGDDMFTALYTNADISYVDNPQGFSGYKGSSCSDILFVDNISFNIQTQEGQQIIRNMLNVSFTDSLLMDQGLGSSTITMTPRFVGFTEAILSDKPTIPAPAIKLSQSDIGMSDNVTITTKSR